MFKGLKDKLATQVQEAGAQIGNIQKQIHNRIGERKLSNGSETGSVGSSHIVRERERHGSKDQAEADSRNSSRTNTNDATLLDIDLDGPPLAETEANTSDDFSTSMRELPGQTLSGLKDRRDSISSVGSMESGIGFLPSMPTTSRWDPFQSDLESVAESDSACNNSQMAGASKEQLSNILHKLQGRAANYKDKYRQLVKIYNSLVKENEKVREVLQTTQDKAIRRLSELREEKKMLAQSNREMEENFQKRERTYVQTINELKDRTNQGSPMVQPTGDGQTDSASQSSQLEVQKLRDLLAKCREKIKLNNDQISQLQLENQKLSKNLEKVEAEQGQAGISDLVTERLVAEWKAKLVAAQEQQVIEVARAKQEIHNELQNREQEIENLRRQLIDTESTNVRELSNLNKSLLQSTEAIGILEKEKKDLVNQLSKSKQEAVNIVRDEEERKRKHMEERHQTNLFELRTSLTAEMHKMEDNYKKKLAEEIEQGRLALEERDLQKMAAVTQQDQAADELRREIEELRTAKLQFEAQLSQTMDQGNARIAQLEAELSESNAKLHEKEHSLQSICEDLKLHLLEEKSKLQQAEERLASMKSELLQRSQEQSADADEELNQRDAVIADLRHGHDLLHHEIEEKSEQIGELKNNKNVLELNLANVNSTIASYSQEMSEMEQTIESLRQQATEAQEHTASLNKELLQLRSDLSEKTEQFLEEQKVSSDLKILIEKITEETTVLRNKELLSTQHVVHSAETSEVSVQTEEGESPRNMLPDDVVIRLKTCVEEKDFEITQQQHQVAELVKKVQELENAIDDYSNKTKEKDFALTEHDFKLRQVEERARMMEDALRDFKENSAQKDFLVSQEKVKYDEQTERIAQLEEALKAHQGKIKEKEFLLSENEMKLNENMEQLKGFEEAIAGYQQTVPDKDYLLTEKEQRICEINDLVKDLEEANADYRSKAEDARRLLLEKDAHDADREQQLLRLEEAVHDYRKTVKENDALIEQQNMDLKASLEKTSKLEQSESDSLARISELDLALSTNLSKLEQAQTKIDELERTIAQQIAKLKDVECLSEEKIRSLEVRLKETETQLKSVQNAGDSQGLQMTILISEKEKLLDEYKQRDQQMLSEVSQSKKLLESANVEVANKNAQIQELQQQVGSCSAKLEATEQSLAEERHSKTKLSVDLKQQSEQVDLLSLKLRESQAEIGTLTDTLAAAKEAHSEQVTKLTEEYTAKTAELKKRAESKLGQIKKQLESDRDKFCEERDKKMAETESAMKDLEVELANSKKELAEAKTTADEYSAAIWELESQLSESKTRLKTAENSLVAKEENISHLTERLNLATSEKDSLHRAHDESNSKAEERTHELEALLAQKETECRKLQDKVKQAMKSSSNKGATIVASESSDAESLRKVFEGKMDELREQHTHAVQQMQEDFHRQLLEKEEIMRREIDDIKSKSAVEKEKFVQDYHEDMNQAQSSIEEQDQTIQAISANYQTRLVTSEAAFKQLKTQHDELQKSLDERIKSTLKRHLEEQHRLHAKELDDLRSEWSHERKELEHQAQIVQGDIPNAETAIYLRERVRQLENEIFILKANHQKELSFLAQGAMLDHVRHDSDSNLDNGDVDSSFPGRESRKSHHLPNLKIPAANLKSVPLSECPASPIFPEPAEAEYLRNILFLYFTERETMGKEVVSLAKAIAAVLKFSNEQTQRIIHKEESRHASWLGPR